MKIDQKIFGYFTESGQTQPTYNPSLSTPCPVCEEPVLNGHPFKTVSFFVPGDHRSFFYRIHRDCADDESEAAIENSVVDERRQA